MELTPEECYERALKLLEKGRSDKAVKLLQIATLRAPGEARYREALQAARDLKANSTATLLSEVDPEDLYRQGMSLVEAGEVRKGSRLLKLAAAKAPGEARYREALEGLRPAPKPAKTQAAPDTPRQTSLERAASKASEDTSTSSKAPSSRSPTSASSIGSGRLIGLAAVALLALLALGGSWYMRQPDRVPIEPYQSQLPVISALSPAPRELVISIDEPAWTALEAEEQESRLRGVMAEATTQGFEAVYVNTPAGKLLGSIRGAQTFIPR